MTVYGAAASALLTLLLGAPLPVLVPPAPSASSSPLPARSVPAPGAYRWPLDGPPLLTRPFDPPARPWLAGHRGVDLAGAPGATVRTAGTGVVWFAGRIAGHGVVSVAHESGLRTTYQPVEPSVRGGDRLFAGDAIGELAAGHPGCTAAACLHWGLRRGAEYLDPLALLGLARVRLLPLGPAPLS